MKKIIFFLIIILIPSFILAEDITNKSTILINNKKCNQKIIDNNENTFINISKNDLITITNLENIYGLYIIYELKSSPGKLIVDNQNIEIGQNDFLHEYIDIQKLPKTKKITINYNNDVKIAEIHLLGQGKLPSFVEIWQKPLNKADLLLFSTHSDDEHLFFAGLLPTYVDKGAWVQVAYLTNHNDNPQRLHEQLHGLYTVGIRNYPIMGIVPDAYSTNLEKAIKNMNKSGLSLDDGINYIVQLLRRFKPLVVVTHDEKGEYSHGQHILSAYLLKIALDKANDSNYHLESYQKYGTWNVLKTYIHLYQNNKIIMDYDTPLSSFNNKTAYEISKEGYAKHLSQQYTWFTKWLNGKNNEYTKSTDIEKYSPNEFGLYRNLVSEDIDKNDVLENITYYKDQVKDTIKIEKKEINKTTKEKNYNKMDVIIGISLILLSLFATIILIIYTKRSNIK